MTEFYHSGERAVQEHAGERNAALLNARGIGNRIPKGARAWLARQPLCILGAADHADDLWAIAIAGRPGFAAAESDGTSVRLLINDGTRVLARIPPTATMEPGLHAGLLFIDFEKRRRLRVNGRIAEIADDTLCVAVDQAYANCPKYIQRRTLRDEAASLLSQEIEAGTELTPALARWIAKADTAFLASAHPDGPADASHRGGRPGFIGVKDGVLRFPDYPGNSMFNSFGNFILNSRAGVTFLDFDAPRQLQLTGEVRLDLDAATSPTETGGTGRFWTFTPRRWVISSLNFALSWTAPEASPFNP